MYELRQAGERSYYMDCPAKVGMFLAGENEVWFIDGGSDRESGRKARQILDSTGWKLKAVLNTHSHADHIGGNRYLQNQTGCRIYAPGPERDITRRTYMEPVSLYGGYPYGELRNKFFVAQESDAEYLTEDVLPEGLKIIPLPGHSMEQVGFETADGVVYLADSLVGEQTLEKYRISFLYDVAAYLETLEKVKTMEAKLFVPAHAPAAEDIAPLAQRNIDSVHQIGEKLLELCKEPVSFEKILQKVFADYGLVMNVQQHLLIGSTVRSYLSWLKDAGRLEICIEDNMLLWRRLG